MSPLARLAPLGTPLLLAVLGAAATISTAAAADPPAGKVFRAGAFAIDVTPLELPVIVNGGMSERVLDKVEDRLHARCLVLDDGTGPGAASQVAIVIVDSCMMPRTLLDAAKAMASQATGIPPERMLIAATHCHSAPSVFECLGSDVDQKYAAFLPVQIAKGIQRAQANLQPARIGWAVGRDDKNVASRRWLMKPGVAPTNRFGGTKNDRVMMHPGPANPNAIAATGPIDADVPVVCLQTRSGEPLAVLTNYSMHYVGAPNISADYFAVVAEKLTGLLQAADRNPAFVAMHSNGTSGDQWLMDYTRPRRMFDRFTVGVDVAQAAFEASQRIVYYDWAPLVMAERLLPLTIRQPTADEVAAAKEFAATFAGRKPKTVEEVYARETILMAEMPKERELKLQALRIGELGIAAIPNEVFSSTGLQIKLESPLPTTFTIELANGCDGYIPPPKQHALGGYETWRARSSCLEVNAEPKIRAAILDLLKAVHATRADEPLVPSLAVAPPPAAAPPPAPKPAEKPAADKSAAAAPNGPLSPADSLKHLHVRAGLRVELVACEPLIADPVAFDWSPDGKLWVVEMADYPTGIDQNGRPGGRLKVLSDQDGDGRYDEAVTLADDLNMPNGLCCYRGGAFVTAAPHILYLKDADGDGRAEIREVRFSGFTEGNPQLRVNGLRWGLDGWLYCGNGIQSRGMVKCEQTGQTLDISGRDFKFDPASGAMESLSGPSQFGRDRDDFGHWFGVQNAKPLIHYVFEDYQLRGNPHYAPPDVRVHVPAIPAPGPVYPRSRPSKFFHESQAGVFTSACGIGIYRDRLLGEEFYGNAFTCEPVHNLVHREIVKPQGLTFTSHRAADEPTSEFLASEDPWFRPVMARTGPDGGLWIADMYRETIEHPQFIPAEKKAGIDARAGSDRGRIYRVLPVGAAARPLPKFSATDVRAALDGLSSPNGTVRDLAERYILETEALRIEPEQLATLLAADRPAAVRLQGLYLYFRRHDNPLPYLLALSDAPERELQVGAARFLVHLHEHSQLSANLGSNRLRLNPSDWLGTFRKLTDSAARAPVIPFLLQHCVQEPRGADLVAAWLAENDDPYLPALVLASLTDRKVVAELLVRAQQRASEAKDPAVPPRLQLGPLLAIALAYGADAEIADALYFVAVGDVERPAAQAWRFAALATFLETLPRHKLTLASFFQRQSPLLTKLPIPVDKRLGRLQALIDRARETVADPHAAAGLRSTAVRLLAHDPETFDDDLNLLPPLLAPQNPAEVQQAAVAALGRLPAEKSAPVLLAGWKGYGPSVRSAALDLLIAREVAVKLLLAAIEAGTIQGSEIDAARRQRLVSHGNAEIKARALALLAAANPDRAAVLKQFEPALALAGDRDRGKLVFTKRCAACHRQGDLGTPVGPDLSGLTDKTPPTLLTSILDPNRSVEARWVSYTATTADGRIFTGLLTEETGASITLTEGENKRHTILRTDLDSLIASGKSLMPEGLEKELSPQDMADLLEFTRKAVRARPLEAK